MHENSFEHYIHICNFVQARLINPQNDTATYTQAIFNYVQQTQLPPFIGVLLGILNFTFSLFFEFSKSSSQYYLWKQLCEYNLTIIFDYEEGKRKLPKCDTSL